MADITLPDDINFPIPESVKEQDLYNTLQDYTKNLRVTLEAMSSSTISSDEKVKASSGDATADYLDGKVDDDTIEVSGDKLQVKDDGITKDKINSNVAGTGLTQAVDGSLEVSDITSLSDEDGDTKVQVEESPDEDIVRIDAGGLEIAALSTNGISMTTGFLSLTSGVSVNEFSSDTALSGNSDTAVPTEKAVKTYIDSISGLSTAVFTSDGNWEAPSGVSMVWITMIGGGGGGAAHLGGGGGAGSLCINHPYKVVATTTYGIQVGDAGAGGTGTGNGSDGQSSIFDTTGNILIALGGGGGKASAGGRIGGVAGAKPSAHSFVGGAGSAGGIGGIGGGYPLPDLFQVLGNGGDGEAIGAERGGGGGASIFGNGGEGGTGAGSSPSAGAYGAGGGGGQNSYNGGAGLAGVVIVKW